MFLRSDIGMSNIQDLDLNPLYLPLGTLSSSFTLTIGKIVTGDITGNYTLTVPATTDNLNQEVCIFDFTTNNASYPTITNTNIILKHGLELTYETSAGTRNRLIFTANNNSDSWFVELERYSE